MRAPSNPTPAARAGCVSRSRLLRPPFRPPPAATPQVGALDCMHDPRWVLVTCRARSSRRSRPTPTLAPSTPTPSGALNSSPRCATCGLGPPNRANSLSLFRLVLCVLPAPEPGALCSTIGSHRAAPPSRPRCRPLRRSGRLDLTPPRACAMGFASGETTQAPSRSPPTITPLAPSPQHAPSLRSSLPSHDLWRALQDGSLAGALVRWRNAPASRRWIRSDWLQEHRPSVWRSAHARFEVEAATALPPRGVSEPMTLLGPSRCQPAPRRRQRRPPPRRRPRRAAAAPLMLTAGSCTRGDEVADGIGADVAVGVRRRGRHRFASPCRRFRLDWSSCAGRYRRRRRRGDRRSRAVRRR